MPMDLGRQVDTCPWALRETAAAQVSAAVDENEYVGPIAAT
jgi:hypothetical protein